MSSSSSERSSSPAASDDERSNSQREDEDDNRQNGSPARSVSRSRSRSASRSKSRSRSPSRSKSRSPARSRSSSRSKSRSRSPSPSKSKSRSRSRSRSKSRSRSRSSSAASGSAKSRNSSPGSQKGSPVRKDRRGSNDDDSDEEVNQRRRMSQDDDERRDNRGDEQEQEQEVEEVPEVRIEADIPRVVADLGSEMYFVKFPNFLSVDTHPYDPSWYEDEIDEDEVLDEEGKGRLKLKVENTIRWRTVMDPETHEEKRESNARIVKWSDGTMSLHLGSEIFDIHKHDMIHGENNHLFVRQGLGLHGQAVFRTKLSFRPHSTDSFTHRKMTLSLADKSQKTHKIRVLPTVGKDPEAHRSEMIKKEEDRLKASIRRENKIRRTRERAHQRGPSASYLEGDYDEEDEDGAISLSAIKNSYKKRDFTATYSDSDDGSDLELRRTKGSAKKPAIHDSDDDD